MALTLKQLYQGSPVVLSPPSMTAAPTTLTTGGSLLASTAYAYRVTARLNGVETLAGVEVSITTGSSTATNSNIVSWTAVPGATDYRVYGRTAGAELLLATVAAGTTSYTDTGVTPSGALPSSSGFSESSLYVPSAGATGLVKSVAVSNPTGYAGQVYLSSCPTSGSDPTVCRLISGLLVLPDTQITVPVSLNRFDVVPTGSKLTGYVTVPGMVLTVNGSEL